MSSIFLDYQQACRQVEEMKDTAECLRKLSANLEDTMQKLSAGWKGDSAAAYLQKSELLKDDIWGTAELLGQIADAVHLTAEELRKADETAADLFGIGSS